jgi:hypothetical protein
VAERNYKKNVRKDSKNAWRTFCSFINDLTMSSMLHRTLSRNPQIQLVCLVAPTGRRTQSEGETLELLLTTNFPNAWITLETVAPAAALLARRPDWRMATMVTTHGRVEWAIDCFTPYKTQRWTAFFRPCCKRRGIFSFRTCSEYFVLACRLAMFQPHGEG